MSSETIQIAGTDAITQGELLKFKDDFYHLVQQKTTKLGGSSAVMYLPSEGKTQNIARMGKIELTKVTGRNPSKQFVQYNLDNRQFTKDRFTATVQIDEKDDINELITSPQSGLMTNLMNAYNRTIDRVISEVAVGDVLVGKPSGAPTTVTAANDGVITVDATGGMSYDTIQSITENFINNDLQREDFYGTELIITGREHTQLMGITQFTNNDYIDSRPVAAGEIRNTGLYGVTWFAGSVSGGITVPNPVLVEGSTNRSCLALAPESVALSLQLASLRVEQSADKVNSKDITIDMWINGMRIEGAKVQKIETTI